MLVARLHTSVFATVRKFLIMALSFNCRMMMDTSYMFRSSRTFRHARNVDLAN